MTRPAVFLFGLSGTGKSTLMEALARLYPDLYVVPPRFTTRPPKTGDREGEVVHLSDAELRERDERGELLFVMQQNARAAGTSLSAYPRAALEGDRTPLLFASIFSLADARAVEASLLVHVRADWRRGLALRGGPERERRERLNLEVEDLFAPLDGRVDLVFENGLADPDRAAHALHDRLCEVVAKRPVVDGTPLARVGPFHAAANVRRPWASLDAVVRAGVGEVGDLVFGELVPPAGTTLAVRDQQHVMHHCGAPVRVLAVLGNRESSTHVNGGIPEGGLAVGHGTEASWLAGESGLVGLVSHEGPRANALAERSAVFRPIGLAATRDGRTLGAHDLAVRPTSTRLAVPIVAVAATSAEAGKTTLCEKLIRELSRTHGLRVAAVKATGTGGTTDSRRHLAAGAVVALDQVDAGLASTYVPRERYLARAKVPFLAAQDAGADVIVAELGGDLPSANNPALLREPWFAERLARLFVIANDSLAALGAATWLHATAPDVPRDRVSLVASPFRNLAGFVRRLDELGLSAPLDPEDGVRAAALARESIGHHGDKPRPEVLDVSAGQPGLLEAFWRRHGGLRVTTTLAAHERMSYDLEGTGSGAPAASRLELLLRELHRRAGNARTVDRSFVLGTGARQLVLAAMHALRRREGRRLRLDAREPFYPFHARIARMAPDLAAWVGAPYAWDGGLAEAGEPPRDAPLVEIVCTPSNPKGESLPPRNAGASLVHDLAYHWPHLAPRALRPLACRHDELMVFSLSKLTGHAGSRLGWAWVADPHLAAGMRELIRHTTIGASGDAEARAVTLVSELLRDGGSLLDRLFEEVARTMDARWERLSPLLTRARLRAIDPAPGFGWLLLAADAELEAALRREGIQGYDGARMGLPGSVRLNLMVCERDFDDLVARLERA